MSTQVVQTGCFLSRKYLGLVHKVQLYGKAIIDGASTPQETPFDPNNFEDSLGVNIIHIQYNQSVKILQMLFCHPVGEEALVY